MVSKTQTGHVKNLANLDELISFVTGYGATYNPSKASLKLAALQALSTSSKNAINAVNTAIPALGNAVAARKTAFQPLNKLVTRVNSSLKATDTSGPINENANSLVHKIQGKRITAKKTEEEKAAAKAEGKEIKEISSTQMSYDMRLDNFDKLIKLLSTLPLYTPNEADLKVAALTALYNDLKTKNAAVVNATTTLSNARITRDDILYKEVIGLVDIAFDVKNYILSLFGATSPQYKQVSSLRFKRRKT